MGSRRRSHRRAGRALEQHGGHRPPPPRPHPPQPPPGAPPPRPPPAPARTRHRAAPALVEPEVLDQVLHRVPAAVGGVVLAARGAGFGGPPLAGVGEAPAGPAGVAPPVAPSALGARKT